jgi:mRNA interferase YafQ
MLRILEVKSFKRDIKRLKRGSFDLSKLSTIILKLAKKEKLEARYSDHLLTGNWKGHRECHIAPDWLLIYKIKDNDLLLIRTGSHSELF